MVKLEPFLVRRQRAEMSLLKWSHFVVISIIKASLNFVNSPVLKNLSDLLDLLNLSDFKDLLEHLDIYLF